MLTRRRLSLAAVAVACLILAAGASADPLDTFTGAAAPSHVKPSTSRSYTISLTSDPSAPNRAQRATIGIPAGFSVADSTVQATTTAIPGVCDASTWDSLVVDQKIQLQRPGGDSNALCPGATLTVTFDAESAAEAATYEWTSELVNETTGAFTLSGSQPAVVVDGTAPTVTITGKPSNPSNDSGPTFVFSADEPATFECKLDGAEFAPCSSPHTYAELTDDGHTFTVRATDTAGNLSAPTSFGWTIDTAAPTATITGRPSDPTKVATATFTFSASEGNSSFSCRLDGGAFESCASPKNYSALGDGPHSFEVNATDQAGNTGGVDAFAWTVDTVAPTTSITSNPPNPSAESSASFSFAASETGTSFSCSLDGALFVSCVSVKSYEALPDGSHTFAVRATDLAGNVSSPASHTWTIDTLAPTAAITGPPSDPSNVTGPSFGFTASESGSTFLCRVDGAAFEPCASPKNYTGLADGPHTFVVRAIDAAGNTSQDASFSWTIDTVAPTAAITGPPSDPSNDTSPSFSFSTNESGSDLACKLDGGAFVDCTSPKNYPGLAEGSHTFALRATDAAGNIGSPASYTWTIDTAAPTATITQAPSDPSNVTGPSFGFTASEPGSTFVCQLDGATPEPCTSPKQYIGLTAGAHTFGVKAKDSANNLSAGASFTWAIDTVAPTAAIAQGPNDPSKDTAPSFTFTASEGGSSFFCRLDAQPFSACDSPKNYTSVGHGLHTFRVKATDPAGNEGLEETYTWRVDTVAPTTTISGKPPSLINASTASFVFAADESGSTFSCRIDGAEFASCPPPKSYTGLADGFHTFAVRATDPAGNEGETETYTWRIDTAPPTTVFTDKPNDPTDQSSASFTFASNEPSTFSCKRDNQTFEACGSTKTYNGLSDGPHTFVVKTVDSAGNSSETSYSWTIDTVAPSANITQKPSSPSNERSPTFTFTSSEAGGTFQCRLEQGGFAPCTSPKGYADLADGQHAFAVRATDLVGNTGAAATYTWTVDTAAPAASITAKPSNPSNSRSPSFSFTASEDGSTFTCRLDAASSPCMSPTSYGGLGDGPHTFGIRATDPAGNTGPETTHSWTIETRAPTAALVSGPSGLSNSSAATFSFAADEPSSFDCSLDGRGFEPCSSPATYHALGDGAHAFSVRAKDAVGNLSAPVGHSWAVDTTAPETRLSAAPASGTATSATFSFAASEGASFECRLDGAPFALCGSPRTYASLTRGDHQFEVRAIDAAGNADATPSLHGWKITTPAAKKVASALLSPRAGARTKRPPLLVWRKTNRARYYNVQVYRGRRKVLTAWPARARLQLKAQWRYLGRKQRLTPGNYRWFVWPGYGVPSARNYGALLGQSSFVVTRR